MIWQIRKLLKIPTLVNYRKFQKKIRLRAKFLKNEYFKAEAATMNQSAINRDLDKLFPRAKNQESTLKAAPGKCPPPQKIFDHFKKTSIQQVLLIQLFPKNLVVTFQNLFMSCKISQINFPSIMKYQPLMRFRSMFAN